MELDDIKIGSRVILPHDEEGFVDHIEKATIDWFPIKVLITKGTLNKIGDRVEFKPEQIISTFAPEEYVNYNYWCQDCNCGKTGSGQMHVITKPKSEEDINEYCLNYKEEYHTDETEGPVYIEPTSQPMKLMGIKLHSGPKNFSSLSPSEKQAALKKRSQEHFKKEVAEVKRHKLKHE